MMASDMNADANVADMNSGANAFSVRNRRAYERQRENGSNQFFHELLLR
jgi:hypothetical protein